MKMTGGTITTIIGGGVLLLATAGIGVAQEATLIPQPRPRRRGVTGTAVPGEPRIRPARPANSVPATAPATRGSTLQTAPATVPRAGWAPDRRTKKARLRPRRIRRRHRRQPRRRQKRPTRTQPKTLETVPAATARVPVPAPDHGPGISTDRVREAARAPVAVLSAEAVVPAAAGAGNALLLPSPSTRPRPSGGATFCLSALSAQTDNHGGAPGLEGLGAWAMRFEPHAKPPGTSRHEEGGSLQGRQYMSPRNEPLPYAD